MPLVGVAYRYELERRLLDDESDLEVLEIMVDHYLSAGARRNARLHELVGRVPLVTHGIGLSLGSGSLPDDTYLGCVASALDRLDARYYSEHLAFTRVGGIEVGELLPLPYTEAVLERVIENIRYVQSFIGCPILLENPAYYFQYPDSCIAEHEFFNALCRETGVRVLLDVENIYANSLNHGHDARCFIEGLSPGSVKALHIGGGEWRDDLFVDDHAHSIPNGALDLMSAAIDVHDPEIIIVERDQNLGDGTELMADVQRVHVHLAGARKSRYVDVLAP